MEGEETWSPSLCCCSILQYFRYGVFNSHLSLLFMFICFYLYAQLISILIVQIISILNQLHTQYMLIIMVYLCMMLSVVSFDRFEFQMLKFLILCSLLIPKSLLICDSIYRYHEYANWKFCSFLTQKGVLAKTKKSSLIRILKEVGMFMVDVIISSYCSLQLWSIQNILL